MGVGEQLPQQRKSPLTGWHDPESGSAGLKRTSRIQSQNTTAGSANGLISEGAFRRNHNTFATDYIKTSLPQKEMRHTEKKS